MAKLEVNEVLVSRSFDHKAHGRVGIVELSAGVSGMSINGKELPATSIEYLLTFALQNLQDAYAGADSADDAKGRFEKKLQRLIEGTIGVREAGDGASATVRMIRVVMGDMLRNAKKWDKVKDLDDAERNAKLDGLYAAQGAEAKAAIDAEVANRIALAAEKAKQRKALADTLELDI